MPYTGPFKKRYETYKKQVGSTGPYEFLHTNDVYTAGAVLLGCLGFAVLWPRACPYITGFS